MVEDHTGLLPVEVATQGDLETSGKAVAGVSSVVGEESFVHLGADSG